MEERQAESAGTFDIASDIIKPRISHIREPRLSKMQLVTCLKGLISKIDLSINLQSQYFTYILHSLMVQMAAVLDQNSFYETHFLL